MKKNLVLYEPVERETKVHHVRIALGHAGQNRLMLE